MQQRKGGKERERDGKKEERERSDRACTTRRELRRERTVNRTLVMCNKERKGKREREGWKERGKREKRQSLYKERTAKRENGE